MNDYLRVLTFSDLIECGTLEIGDGYRAKNSELGGDGIVFMKAGRLKGSGWDWTDADRFHTSSELKFDKKKSHVGDTVITTKGNSTGRTGYVSPGTPSFVYSPHLSYWRSTDDSALNCRFLRYWATGQELTEQLKAMAHGTDMAPYLSLSDQKRLTISLPPIADQRRIGATLGALDDKIAVNERIATKADELSASIFKRAQIESPNQFFEQALSNTAEFINGRAFTKGATGDGRMVIRIAEINNGPSGSTVYNRLDVPEKHLARPGDVLFAWSGSLTVARWFRPESIINQHIFKCVPRNGNSHWLVNQLVHWKIDEFRAIASDKATTMGHIQRKHLDEPVQVPNLAMLQKLDTQISPLWGRALCAEQESLSLATLRDTLLPQLMSGRLRVKDAEKIVEDQV
ncbi:restriction endonuclease subunit S [Streptomyces sp. NPDC006864]|uniref:restriction endonuclease subunit S n=1 Tax=Streptomyces sp. NPDC006864 TaxID=3154780 RepID=UPI00345145E7